MRATDIIIVILFIIMVVIAMICALRSDKVQLGSTPLAWREARAIYNRQTPNSLQRTGRGRSKLEANIIKILEGIFNGQCKFDQAHPTWLHESGASQRNVPLELDGYNEEKKVAIEVQGPGHIKPISGETYEKYQKRIARDVLKRSLCDEHGVHLITVDYRISLVNVEPYLRSRLFDIGICVRPLNYIKELSMVPWVRGQ